MHSSILKDALKSTELLSMEIRKRRTLVALNDFIDERINGTQNAIQPLTEDITLSTVIQLHNKEVELQKEELKTDIDESGVIKTEEMCYVPFPFVQTETLQYQDGRKVITTFYPNYKKIPSKMVEYSADKSTVTTVTYSPSGDKKTLVKKQSNADGTAVEEKIDFVRQTKEVKKYNSYNVVTEIENYVEDRLSFKMQCDVFGNIISEKTYFAYSPQVTLKKEVLYDLNQSYTVTEYAYDGRVTHSETMIVKK